MVCESRLELARIPLAEQDRDVMAITALPFLLEDVDGDRMCRHVPDLLLARADGGFTVVDVKSAAQVTDSVLLGNVRFLAGDRRPVTIALEMADAVMAAVSELVELGVLERSLAR